MTSITSKVQMERRKRKMENNSVEYRLRLIQKLRKEGKHSKAASIGYMLHAQYGIGDNLPNDLANNSL